MTEIKEGDQVIDFALIDQSGEEQRLSEHLEKGPVVVYFYPKSFSPGCLVEACQFRDHYTQFLAAGAQVMGISSDIQPVQRTFANVFNIPFPILSDLDGLVREQWGVPKTMGVMDGRVTYVVDGTGAVRRRYTSQVRVQNHIQEAMSMIQELSEA